MTTNQKSALILIFGMIAGISTISFWITIDKKLTSELTPTQQYQKEYSECIKSVRISNTLTIEDCNKIIKINQ